MREGNVTLLSVNDWDVEMQKCFWGSMLALGLFCGVLHAQMTESPVYSENFENKDAFVSNGKTESGHYQGWSAEGTYDKAQGYALARILPADSFLSLQDFRWGGNPPGAAATTPEFGQCRFWKITFRFQWNPIPKAANKGPVTALMQALNKDGAAIGDFTFTGDMKDAFGPGKIAIAPGDWYKIILTYQYSDDVVDSEIECTSYGKSQTHAIAQGEKKRSSLLRLKSASPDPLSFVKFIGVNGWDFMGTLNIDDLQVSKLDGKPAIRQTQGAYVYQGDTYLAVFQSDGVVDLYGRDKGEKQFLGSVGGVKIQGDASTVGKDVLIKLKKGKATAGAEDRVDFEGIATTIAGEQTSWPVVEIVPESKENFVIATWTLMPGAIKIQYSTPLPQEEQNPEKNGDVILTLAPGVAQSGEIKPARWIRDIHNGVPSQVTRGMAAYFQGAGNSFSVANDKGFKSLIDGDAVHVYFRKTDLPWQKSTLRAAMSLTFGGQAAAAMNDAVALAADDRIALNVQCDQPFYLYDETRPIRLPVSVRNISDKRQRVDVSYVAYDYDGQKLAEGKTSGVVEPLGRYTTAIELLPKERGPVYLDVTADHSEGSDYQRICLGVMPEREFADADHSRFGISAYRGNVGPHTELRTEEQLLGMMKRIGVRWLRATGKPDLARSMGFGLWYHNNLPYSQAVADYFQGKENWLSDPAKREAFIASNIKTALANQAVTLEFTNEWNLDRGDNKAYRAEKYAKDWLPLLKKVRDEMAPNLRLAGGVVANADLPFLKKMHDCGAWDDFDVLAFHSSGVPKSSDLDGMYWSYLETLKNIRMAIRQFGVKELWMTEFYAPAAPNYMTSYTERSAAENLTLMCALAIAADVRCMMYYCFDDFDRQPEIARQGALPEPVLRENYFGLVRRDWTPKASLWAYENCAWIFDGAAYVGDVKLPVPALNGLLFKGKSGPFALLWSRQEGYANDLPFAPRGHHREPWVNQWSQSTPLMLKAGGGDVYAVDCLGRRRNLAPDQNGMVRIDLTGEPIFVFGVQLESVRGRFTTMFYPEIK